MSRFQTFDKKTRDAAGAFLKGQLEVLDPRINLPLVMTDWRDSIKLRGDVSDGNDTHSYALTSFGSARGASGSQISWASLDATTLAGMSLEMGKLSHPMEVWGHQISYTIPELQSAMLLGSSLEQSQFNALTVKLEMDTDKLVYIGDTTKDSTGLLNAASVTNNTNIITGTWSTATADQILADINEILISTWEASAWAVYPTELKITPTAFSILATRKVSTAGDNKTILQFVLDNNITVTKSGQKLNITPNKWLIGTTAGGVGPGAAGKDRMVAYTNNDQYVRFVRTPMRREQVQYVNINVQIPYWCKFGRVETIYPQTIAYRDGT